MPYPLYAIGNALVDIEYLVNDQFLQDVGIEKGTMRLASLQEHQALLSKLHNSPTGRVSGGSAANSTYAYAALGGQAAYCCRVGDDEDGHFYISDLNKANITISSMAYEPGHVGTGNCIVLVTPDGERTMQTWLGITGSLGPTQVALGEISLARILYIEGYLATSDSAKQAVAIARAQARLQGAKIAISFSDPAMVEYAKTGLLELMSEGVDYLFCNLDEAQSFTQLDSVEAAASRLHDYAKTIIITMGANGALVSEAPSLPTQLLPAVKVSKVIDTNGAGDAYAGSFLYGIAQGWHIAQAGALAAAISAAIVSQYGPRLPYPQYKEILSGLKNI